MTFDVVWSCRGMRGSSCACRSGVEGRRDSIQRSVSGALNYLTGAPHKFRGCKSLKLALPSSTVGRFLAHIETRSSIRDIFVKL